MPRKKELLERKLKTFFVGRESELSLFQGMLECTADFSLLFIWGMGGIGKSTLLKEFKRICVDRGTPVALIDGALSKSVGEILRSISEQLKSGVPSINCRNFAAELQRYLQIHTKLHQESGASEIIFKLLAKGLAVGSEVIPYGHLAFNLIGEQNIEIILNTLYRLFTKPEVDFYLNPERSMTEALIEDLNEYGARDNIVIMFDMYEAMENYDNWVREDLFPNLEEKIIIIIAGRNPPLREMVSMVTPYENCRITPFYL